MPGLINTASKAISTEDIRAAAQSLLHGINTSAKPQIVEPDFRQSCRELMDSRNYLLTENLKARRAFLEGGLSMGAHAYRHLEQRSPMLRKLICMYTTYLIWIDDTFVNDTSTIDAFNMHFVHGQPQNTKDLDDFAALVKEMAGYYDTVSANLFLTSTMNFVTSLTFEFQTQGMPVHPRADAFPTFTRFLSGASEAYTVFIFPPHSINVKDYIQALPNMMIFINNTNDVLSFYKEEDAGETVNRVSLMASMKRIDKKSVLMDYAGESVTAWLNALDVLKGKESYAAFRSFTTGYVGSHTSVDRYRLQELGLEY